MDAARSEAALRDFESAAFAEDHVLERHLHVFEQDFAVAVRRVVITEHGQHAQDLHARRVHGHEDLRLLAIFVRVGIGLAHHDHDLAARIADARRPPFAAVDDVVVALASRCGVEMFVASDEATAGSVMM